MGQRAYITMSKKLLIIRHAHAEDYAKSGKDIDRMLTPKGENSAVEMANELLQEDIKIDLMTTSPASRAKRTAELFAQELAYPIEKIVSIEGIYEANLYNLLGIINRIDEQFDTVVIFGHNPAFTYLADYLGDKPIDGLPKAGMILLDFGQRTWANVGQASGKTIWLKSPKGADFW